MPFPFLAGKRGAEITTDIADKGKQRFFITTLLPPPAPHLPPQK